LSHGIKFIKLIGTTYPILPDSFFETVVLFLRYLLAVAFSTSFKNICAAGRVPAVGQLAQIVQQRRNLDGKSCTMQVQQCLLSAASSSKRKKEVNRNGYEISSATLLNLKQLMLDWSRSHYESEWHQGRRQGGLWLKPL